MKRIILTTAISVCTLSLTVHGQGLPSMAPLDVDSLMRAQANDSMLAQLVESRKGYVARVPAVASLDSSRSGWNPKELYERRVYTIEGAGAIVFTATVGPTVAPAGATQTQSYTYVERDSLTSAGTVWVRTYYLPTRSVKIELIPYGIAMRKFIEQRERIFGSFRWMQGAETDAIDIEKAPQPIPPGTERGNSLGG